jgi:hypothetical protein|tara:strand:- start:180 stop:296 length:117 start_codon:yes stop_codon:yes gene_type:complete
MQTNKFGDSLAFTASLTPQVAKEDAKKQLDNGLDDNEK